MLKTTKFFVGSSRSSRLDKLFTWSLIGATIVSVVALVLQPITSSASAASIASLSQTSGSVKGGDKITIKGSDFMKDQADKIVYLGGGSDFSILRTSSGKIYTWGKNESGQLGTGDNTDYTTPQDITKQFGGDVVKSVHIASSSVFALMRSGKIYSWGKNDAGQLGTSDNNSYNVPQDITPQFGGETIKTINDDGSSIYAATKSGKLYSWGANIEGVLGTGDDAGYNVPQDITPQFGGDRIDSFSIYYGSVTALTKSGKVFTWGYNAVGQLAVDDTRSQYAPQDVTSRFNDEKIVRIGVGYAVSESGKTYVWGWNDEGRLGIGDIISYITLPRDITDAFKGEEIEGLARSRYGAFYVSESGKIFSNGDNSYGQLGTGNNIDYNTPQDITDKFNGDKIKSMSTYGPAVIVLTTSGTVYVWGKNDFRQLGTGDNENYNTPQNISKYFNGEKINSVTMLGSSAFALTDSGKIYAWGKDSSGQFGTNLDTAIPQDITANFNLPSVSTSQIAAIYFGNTQVSDYKVIDESTIELTVPAHVAGKVDVNINSIDGNETTLASGYEYVDNASTDQPLVTNTTNPAPTTVDPKDIVAPNTGAK